MSGPRGDMQFGLGMDGQGLARVLRTDNAGRLEVVLAGGLGVFQRQVVYTLEGVLQAGPGSLRIPNATGAALTIQRVRLDLGSPAGGAAVLVDCHKDGLSIFADQALRPAAAPGALWALSGAPDQASWAPGETLTVDIDQVGSAAPGSDLTVTVLVV